MPTQSRRFTGVVGLYDDNPCDKEAWASHCEPGETVLDVTYSDEDASEISQSSMLVEVVMGTAE